MKEPVVTYRILKCTLNFLINILFKVKVTGYDNFDHNIQYVIIGNHISWLDYLTSLISHQKISF